METLRVVRVAPDEKNPCAAAAGCVETRGCGIGPDAA
jgi:hypothetical protein